ncbi:poly(ADP-ribose) polymerase 2 [Actinidia rufa]|uniref:Poly(ADP-ribose) polymerase 2 n=1 Tax=Actinidia rufa TaxID=165716 RepID=A0A7J0DLB8_9ERIC|nr:poly(ADP-ribose) polymerase 2 [Actinidia rufa]
MYHCHGYLPSWNKCSYTTIEPKRVKGKWKIPKEVSKDYLCKFEWPILSGLKSQKAKNLSRMLPPPSSDMPCGNQATNGQHQPSKGEKMGDLNIDYPRNHWMSGQAIEGFVGQVPTKIKKVSSGVLDNEDAEMNAARIGLLGKNFSHLKGKGNLISLLPTVKNLGTRYFYGMVS